MNPSLSGYIVVTCFQSHFCRYIQNNFISSDTEDSSNDSSDDESTVSVASNEQVTRIWYLFKHIISYAIMQTWIISIRTDKSIIFNSLSGNPKKSPKKNNISSDSASTNLSTFLYCITHKLICP